MKYPLSRFAPSPWKRDATAAAGRPLQGGRWFGRVVRTSRS